MFKKDWRDVWFIQFEWIEFNSSTRRVFYKICREKGGKKTFATEGFESIKVSAFQDHACSQEHMRLSWVVHKGMKTMENAIALTNKSYDEAILSLFKATNYIGKETIPFSKFLAFYHVLVSLKAYIT